MLRRVIWTLAAALVAIVLAAGPQAWPAQAAGNPVIADCTAHNQLTRHYSLTQLQGALNSLPVDVKEYTACYDVIQRQLDVQLGRTHGNGAGNGGGGSFLPVPVIILLALLIVGGIGFAGLSTYRGRASAPPEDPSGDPPARRP